MVIKVDNMKCCVCGGCVSVCPVDALELKEEIKCDNGKCTKCGTCVKLCPTGALLIVAD